MSNWPQDLDRFLQTDPRDAGCDTAVELLHVYAELAAADPTTARRRYPEVAAHLRWCSPCEQDLDGLLAAIRAGADIAESLPLRRTSRPGVSPRRCPAANPLSAVKAQHEGQGLMKLLFASPRPAQAPSSPRPSWPASAWPPPSGRQASHAAGWYSPRTTRSAGTRSNAVATFTINHDSTLTLVDRAATGQAATCWIAAAGTAFYASTAGSGTLTGYRDDGSGALQAAGTTATDPGTVDAAASGDGRYLYVQAGAAGTVDEFHVNPGASLTRSARSPSRVSPAARESPPPRHAVHSARRGKLIMPLLHPGDAFPEVALSLPGGQSVTVPEAFGGDFGVMLFYRGS
jgi:hypothetical protein